MALFVEPSFDVAGVTLASAAAWLRGEFTVGNRLRDCPHLDFSRCEIAFLNAMDNLASYRAACAAAVDLRRRGAVAAVAHIVSPVFWDKLRRHGALICHTERIFWHGQEHPAARVLIPAAGWQQWAGKIRTEHIQTLQNTSQAAFVTGS